MSLMRDCSTWNTWSWLVFFVCFLFVGCVPRGTILQRTDSVYVERTIERNDTTYIIAPDSAVLRLLVECDSNFQAVVRALDIANGERINASARTERAGNSAAITIDCKEDSLRVLVERLKETIRTTSEHNEVQIVKEKYIPPFAKFSMWWFVITAAILLAIVAVKIYSRFIA